MKKTTKALLVIIVGGAILVFAGFSYLGNKIASEIKNYTPTYKTVNVKMGALEQDIDVVGNLVTRYAKNSKNNYVSAQVKVNELDILKIKKGQSVELQIPAYKDEVIDGTVEKIDNVGTIENDTTTFTVKIKLNEYIKELKTGMTVKASILLNVQDNVKYIPLDAIQKKDDGTIYVIQADTLKEIEIKTGINNDEYIQVTEGLDNKDKIVLPDSISELDKVMMSK